MTMITIKVTMIKKENTPQPPIPSNYVIGKVLEDEDSFFSSIAECLQQLKNVKTNSKELWQKCQQYLQEYLQGSQAFDNNPTIIYGMNLQDYLAYLEKAVAGPPNSVMSRPEHEGRIICHVFNVNIHILKKPDHENPNWWHSIVNRLGQNRISDVDYESIDTIHVMHLGDLHFKPLLKITQELCQDFNRLQVNEDHEATIETYEVREGTRGSGGQFYEIKLLMLLYLRLQVCNEFYLAGNMANVGAFDDAVFKYKFCEKDELIKTKIVFLQAKHSDKSGLGRISMDSLLDPKGAFSLKKYFQSFQTIKMSFEAGKGPIFTECFDDCRFIIFTNYNLDVKCKKDICNPSRWFNCAMDEIAVGKEHTAKRLNPNEDINRDIIANLTCNPIRELAQEIYDYTLGKKSKIGIKVSNELLQKYHISLANKVFTVNKERPNNSKFSTKFHESESLWKQFCQIAGNSQNEEQFRENLAKVTINLHKNFGKHENKLNEDSHINDFPILSLPGPDEVGTEDKVREFLTKLEFVLGQKNEKDLDQVIETEIQQVCKVNDEEETQAIFGSVKSKVEEWWKSGKKFLTKQTKFIENAQTSISNFKLNIFENGLKKRIKKTGVQFKETALDELKNVIHNHKTLNIVADDGTTLLSVVKSYQTLKREVGKIKYNFMTVDHVLNIQEYVLRVFQSKDEIPYYLVIESNSELLANVQWARKENIRSFYKKLFELTEQSSNKHVILITEKCDEHGFNLHQIYLDISFGNLTVPSHLQLLDTLVMIQGMRVKIKDLTSWNDSEFINKISSKLVMSLINEDEIVINNAPQRLCESEAAYTKFYDEMPLENLVNMITISHDNTVIVISGSKEQNYGLLTELVNLSVIKVVKDAMASHIKRRIDDETIIIIPDSNPANTVKEFQKICSRKCEKTIYWIEINSELVFLQQVYYPNFYLKREFRKNVVLSLEVLCQENFPEELVFTADDKQKVQKLLRSMESKYMLHFRANTNNNTIIFGNNSIFADIIYSDLKPNTSAHWLKIADDHDGQFIWDKSQGAVPDMQTGNPVFPSDLLVQECNPHVFIFSDIKAKKKVKHMIKRSCLKRNKLYSRNCKVKQIRFIKAGHSKKNIKQDKQTVHWLKLGGNCNEQLIWEKSQGSIDTVRGFIDKDGSKQERHSEQQMSAVKDKVVVIADEPGMGKTTSLTSISQLMLNENWVIRINFLDCEHSIDTVKESNLTMEDVYNFVSKVESTGLRNDWAKLLMKHKLTLDEPNTWPILFLFDGFDEIHKKRQQKVLPFLQFIKYQTTARLWVTTRFHMMDVLENGLSAFATVFEELSQEERLEFLNRSWIIRLSPFLTTDNIKQKTEKYSSCLLEQVSNILGAGLSDSLGVPLQLRLLAEALRQDYVNYINGSDDDRPKFGHVDVMYVYRHFIREKYEIYIRDKNRLNMNKPFKEPIFKRFDKNHEMLAFNLLFPEDAMIKPKRLSRAHEDILKSVGIIQSIGMDGKPHFIHRTFAEFFVAKLLIRYVRKKKSNPIEYDSAAKFLNKHIYEKSSHVIRNFINHMSIDPNKDFPIHIATMQNKLTDVMGLMKDTKNRQICDKFEKTPLHIAACEGHLNVVKALLDCGCDVIAQDVLGKTALHYAVMNRLVKVVEHILNYTADINICDNIFNTPLQIDVEIGDSLFEEAKQLNSKLVILTNIKDIEGKAPLHYATEIKDWKIASMLIVNGANISPLTDETVLEILRHISIRRQFEEYKFGYLDDCILGLLMLKFVLPTYRVTAVIIKYLFAGHIKVFHAVSGYLSDQQISQILDRFATEQERMETICDEDHLKVSQYLMQEQNDDRMANKLGKDAARLGNLETMKYVLAQGHNNDYISYMKCAIQGHNLNIVKLLEENFTHDDDGNTALHVAARFGSLQIVKYLVENNADVKALNKEQNTPVDIANEIVEPYLRMKSYSYYDKPLVSSNSGNQQPNASLLLSNQNANTAEISEDEFKGFFRKFPKGIDGNGATKVHWAAFLGIIDKQKSFPTNFQIQDNNGCTPLHYAVKNDQIEMVKFLLLHHAKFNPKSKVGKTPLHIAKGHSVKKFLNKINDIFITFQNGGSNIESLKSMQLENNDYFIAAINCKDDYGSALLEYATSANDIDSVLFILRNGGSLELCPENPGGTEVRHLLTCLHNIKKSILDNEGQIALKYVECFDKYSGIADIRNDHNNFLHDIANKESVNYYLLNYLVKHGANVNALDKSNRSVIFIAIDNNNLDLIKFLLYRGVNIKDLTPDAKQRLFDCAEKNGRPDITDLFETLLQQTEQAP